MKIQPVLPPPLTELFPAYHVAPPVAFELEIDRKSTLTVPLDLDMVLVPEELSVVLATAESPVSVKSSKNVVTLPGIVIVFAPAKDR